MPAIHSKKSDEASWKEMSTDKLLDEAVATLRPVAALFRFGGVHYTTVKRAQRILTFIARERLEEGELDGDPTLDAPISIALTQQQRNEIFGDIAAMFLMLGHDGWIESDEPDGAELAAAVHDLGAKLLTTPRLDSALVNRIAGVTSRLQSSLGRTLVTGAMFSTNRPPEMTDMLGVLVSVEEGVNNLRSINGKLYRQIRKLKKERKAARRYFGRILKQVQP